MRASTGEQVLAVNQANLWLLSGVCLISWMGGLANALVWLACWT